MGKSGSDGKYYVIIGSDNFGLFKQKGYITDSGDICRYGFVLLKADTLETAVESKNGGVAMREVDIGESHQNKTRIRVAAVHQLSGFDV